MAVLFNEQPVLGVRLVADGTVMHNGTPVIGIVDATGKTFIDNQRVVGVAVLTTDDEMHNDRLVRGAVLIGDGRKLYYNQLVVPVEAISGVLA